MSYSLPVVELSKLDFGAFKTTVGLITPDIAEALLSKNFDNNRKLGQSTVRRYSRLMKEGKWGLSDPIKVTGDGELIDGQHRLSAVVHSGAAVPFVIITGYSIESAEYLDQGKKRTANNVLQLRGVTCDTHAVSVIRMAVIMGKGGTEPHTETLSTTEVANLVEYFHDGLHFAGSNRNFPGAVKSSPVLAAIFMAYESENRQRLSDFLQCWHSGMVKNGVEDNAALVLKSLYFSKFKERAGAGLSARVSLFKYAQSALSHFLRGTCPRYFKETSSLIWGQKTFSPKNIKSILNEYSKSQADTVPKILNRPDPDHPDNFNIF